MDALPAWMETVSDYLPLTHAIEAAREVAAGETLATVGGLIGRELGIGVVYGALGMVALRLLEEEGRRKATLEIQ